MDNQSLSGSLLRIQEILPLVVTIHHPITKDHKLEMQNATNWKEKLSSKRWHNFLPMQKRVAPKLKKLFALANLQKKMLSKSFMLTQIESRLF